MKEIIENISNGKMDGKIFYICDIRHNGNPFEKFIRNVKPTKVIVTNNDELPKSKRIYYSESYFVPLDKNDKPSKKVIGLYDNTGYRSYTGTPLNVFENMKDCEDCYSIQKKSILSDMESHLNSLSLEVEDFRNEI